MKPSIDKLRWVLAGGSLFLLLLLVAVVGYGRYKAARLWKNRLDKLGVRIEQTSDNITYSQTIGGRTVGILRAAKAVQRKDGKTVLHNVQLTLFGKRDGSEDRIYGSEFEYDEKAGLARALGEVEMDIRAPGSLSLKNNEAKPELAPSGAERGDERDIHVRTSGLTYVRKLGVAATDQQVMFSYAGLQCTAKGAEFNSSDNIVHLLADVQMQGTLHGKMVNLRAAKADLDHDSDLISLTSPLLTSSDETARSANALLYLRHDGSLETAQADGDVFLQKGTREITAARLHGSFSAGNVPQQAHLNGGVKLVDTSGTKPMRGSATRVDGEFTSSGTPLRWTASGGAELTSTAQTSAGQKLSRTLKGEQIVATMTSQSGPAKSALSELHVMNGAQASAENASTEGVRHTQLAADQITAQFGPAQKTDSPLLRQVFAVGHTRLQQDAPGGAQQVSTGENLQMHFAPDPAGKGELKVVSAAQDGDVRLQSRSAARKDGKRTPDPVAARADHSVYEGGSDNLTLSGRAEFSQGGTTLTANTLVVNQRTGDSDAAGNVLATLTPSNAKPGAQATHIHAEKSHLVHETQLANFQGTDAQPAKLWQGSSQLEAATITFDGKQHLLSARPDAPGASVRTVFASSNPGIAGQSREGQVERVTARSLDYDDVARVATFHGNIRAVGSTGQVQAQQAQMFFAGGGKAMAGNASGAAPSGNVPTLGGTLERAVLWEDVKLSQPGKTGRGDKLVYTAVDSTFVLTGSPSRPPQIVDAERGNVTGASLTFKSGDNTVVVSSSTASTTPGEHVRVHTETGAKQ